MNTIYITHCTYKKNDSYKNTTIQLRPEELYTGTKIHRFINKCKELNVPWAIFSDLYGVWHPGERHIWYEKHPDSVNEVEFEHLIAISKSKLAGNQVCFYGNYKSHYFHPLYRNVVQRLKEDGVNIRLISKFKEIIPNGNNSR